MAEDARFRQGLPIGFLQRCGTGWASADGADEPPLARDLKQAVSALLTERLPRYVSVHDAADAMAEDFMVHRLPPPTDPTATRTQPSIGVQGAVCCGRGVRGGTFE